MITSDTDYKSNINRIHADDIFSFDSSNRTDNNEQITFINYSHSYCICFVDIVSSTKNICGMTESNKIQEYYSVFLNTMGSIIKSYNGRAVKNAGDGLLYYFPRTFDLKNEFAFQNALDCGLDMIEENEKLNQYYRNRGLSTINYRVSANYGRVELAMSLNSNSVDIFGSPVNLCSKINQLACPNQMIIHDDLHEVLKKTEFYNQYVFRNASNNQLYGDTNYIIFSVDRRENNINNGFNKKHPNKLARTNVSPNILIIDDDKDILFTFKTIIHSEGYHVDSYSSPYEALGHFSHIDPYFYDLIIMDIRMPELNGILLYSKIKAINPEVKVIFLSALNAVDEVLSIFPEIRHSEIIRKPIEPDVLLSKISSILQP